MRRRRTGPSQRYRLAQALLRLTPQERQLCDRRYHGRWSVARLAAAAGVHPEAMRKRLQRIRERLRTEIEMAEQRDIVPGEFPVDLPGRVVELLAGPRLTDLPENPVGRVLELLHPVCADFTDQDLPEVVDLPGPRRPF